MKVSPRPHRRWGRELTRWSNPRHEGQNIESGGYRISIQGEPLRYNIHMVKEFTMDGDRFRTTAYEHFRHRSERLQAIIHQIYLHTMIKGHLLAGRSQSWIAKQGRVSKKTINEVINQPLLALEELHYHHQVDPDQLLDSIFDKSHSSMVTARGAITACMAYDCRYITPNEPASTLEVRYHTSREGILAHVQHVHSRVTVHHLHSHDPGRSADTVDFCARVLGCDDEWIQRAKHAIDEWLTTPVVPESPDIVFRGYRPRRNPRRRLDDILNAQRWMRESRELEQYGCVRPTVDDTDESPAALARDLMLCAEKFNTQVERYAGRTQALQKFGRTIGIAPSGLNERGRIAADSPDEWIQVIDAALYSVHDVHLPHIQLQDDQPWPQGGGVLPPPSWMSDLGAPFPQHRFEAWSEEDEMT